MNRKQKKRGLAAGDSTGTQDSSTSTSTSTGSATDTTMSLARPSRIRQKGKTLLELAAERQGQLGQSSATTPPDEHEQQQQQTAAPILDTIFLALPLSCLHFTLSFLAAHQ